MDHRKWRATIGQLANSLSRNVLHVHNRFSLYISSIFLPAKWPFVIRVPEWFLLTQKKPQSTICIYNWHVENLVKFSDFQAEIGKKRIPRWTYATQYRQFYTRTISTPINQLWLIRYNISSNRARKIKKQKILPSHRILGQCPYFDSSRDVSMILLVIVSPKNWPSARLVGITKYEKTHRFDFRKKITTKSNLRQVQSILSFLSFFRVTYKKKTKILLCTVKRYSFESPYFLTKNI